MAAIAFDTLQYARRLKEAGVPERQAEVRERVQAELMAEAFVLNLDTLVTRDYLEARLSEVEARMELGFGRVDGKFRLIFCMLVVIIASTTLPALQGFLSG